MCIFHLNTKAQVTLETMKEVVSATNSIYHMHHQHSKQSLQCHTFCA